MSDEQCHFDRNGDKMLELSDAALDHAQKLLLNYEDTLDFESFELLVNCAIMLRNAVQGE